jgi:hypothetical protein
MVGRDHLASAFVRLEGGHDHLPLRIGRREGGRDHLVSAFVRSEGGRDHHRRGFTHISGGRDHHKARGGASGWGSDRRGSSGWGSRRGGVLGLPHDLLMERRGLVRPPPQSAACAVFIGATCGAPEGAGIVLGGRGRSAWCGETRRRRADAAQKTFLPLRRPRMQRRGTQVAWRFGEGASPTPVAPSTDRGGGTRPHQPPASTTLETPRPARRGVLY